MTSLTINCRFLSQHISGVQRYAIELSKQIKRLVPSARFLAPCNILHEDIAQILDVDIIGKHTGQLWEQFDLPRYLSRIGNPLLLNLGNLAPIFYPNNIVVLHSLAFLKLKDYSLAFKLYYRIMIPQILKSARHAITVSQYTRNEIIEHYKLSRPENISVVYPSYVPEFKVDPTIKREKYILAVGSPGENKNTPGLIKAFHLLNDPKLRLIIVGGMDTSVFKKQSLPSGASEHIIFTDQINDKQKLRSYYQKASLFVFPSFYESFGIPLLEAMACGCPVITSDIPVLRETCGEAAIYCNPNNPADIAGQIARVLNDEKLSADLRSRGLEQIRRFSWEASARRLIEIIHRIEPSWHS